ncbi:MAG: hypothetical protein K2O11_02465, partial [Oscillospiraceae bacterium]|nr:hypothetical protein [Oscillospiraceae bacterium]
MKKLSKILSVGLSLVMCASLVAPSFAASFGELQGAIDTGESVYKEDGTTYKIEASKNEETGAVNVKLHEEVKYESGDPGTITISNGNDVTLDLNGNDIDAQYKPGASVIAIDGGSKLTLADSTAEWVEDEDGNETYVSGAITGGFSQNGDSSGGGGVTNYGTLIMTGGSIAENKSNYYAGGVYNKGTVIMEDGVIADNECGDCGGGVRNYGTFTMNGGAIADNTSGYYGHGGGVYNEGAFTMTDGTIAGNSAGNGGGLCNEAGRFTMEGGSIEDNTAVGVGGGVRDVSGIFIMTGGTISDNKAEGMGDEIEFASTVKIILPEDSAWDSDNYSDRMDGVMHVYSGEELNSGGNRHFDLKHHEHTFTTTKEPTCTEPGEKSSSGCICGQTVTEEIPALGHDWGEWEVTKEPSPGVEGEETRVCARDHSHIETRPIPAKPVTNPDPEKPDPTKPDP